MDLLCVYSDKIFTDFTLSDSLFHPQWICFTDFTLSGSLFHSEWICSMFPQGKLSRILTSVVLYFIPSGFFLCFLRENFHGFFPQWFLISSHGFVPCFLREKFHGFFHKWFFISSLVDLFHVSLEKNFTDFTLSGSFFIPQRICYISH